MAKNSTSKKGESVAKKPATKKAPVKKLIDAEMYTFRGNGIAPSLKKGMEYKVTGFYAAHFIKQGYGEIID